MRLRGGARSPRLQKLIGIIRKVVQFPGRLVTRAREEIADRETKRLQRDRNARGWTEEEETANTRYIKKIRGKRPSSLNSTMRRFLEDQAFRPSTP